jgi:hypothetical protein
MYPSKKFRTVGIEIKVHRSDFLREVANPDKAAAFSDHVTDFWIAAPPGVANPAELPVGWGLWELRGGKLYTRRAAQQDFDRELTRDHWLGLVRSARRAVDRLRVERSQFATLAGKPISIADLQRLAGRVPGYVHPDDSVRRRVSRTDAKKSAEEWRNRWGKVHAAIAEAIARTSGRDSWSHRDPEQVLAWVESQEAPAAVSAMSAKLAPELRRLADLIDGGTTS